MLCSHLGNAHSILLIIKYVLMLLYFFTICFLIIYMIGLKCLRLQFKEHWFPNGFSTRIVGEGISPSRVAYAGLCKWCTLVFKNIVFPQTSKEIWNSVNSFVKVPCLGNAKWICSIESQSKGKSSMCSTLRWGTFAYNTIPTAEEVLNGDVYCTLSD